MSPKSPLDQPLRITLVDGEVVFLGEGAVNFSMTAGAARRTLARLSEALRWPARVVLLVQDEPIVRELGVSALEGAGYGVIVAETAAEALRALEGGALVHLVFTDIQTPGEFDGLELARRVSDRWPAIHLLLSSGRALSDRELPARGRFLAKPYLAADVLRHVGEMTAA